MKPTHIIHKMPAPKEMVKKFNKGKAIREYTEALGKGVSPYERAVILQYVDAMMNFELAKFNYNGLKKPYADKIKYSHEIGMKGETLEFIRHGKAEPTIIEKMKANYNIT